MVGSSLGRCHCLSLLSFWEPHRRINATSWGRCPHSGRSIWRHCHLQVSLLAFRTLPNKCNNVENKFEVMHFKIKWVDEVHSSSTNNTCLFLSWFKIYLFNNPKFQVHSVIMDNWIRRNSRRKIPLSCFWHMFCRFTSTLIC